ncbi:MAG: hypothetical protein AUK47_04470 [Deltaproteobacteria bacterium CG2_30_63_29]|nr:MAG: hypothetical protein AUK47_04470 [Deltaproteobacteria bacterium CG2_30_63_29]PJB35526.1 MAG: RNA methyltransferase [Deltaproteobacteria bacterium CG_4_9_14_3_um_filter_63_12]
MSSTLSLFESADFLATTARGAESYLFDELTTLGAQNLELVPGGVTFSGSLELATRACLWLRTATKVLLRIGLAEPKNEDELYEVVRAMNLAQWFDADHTVAVWAHVNDEVFRNSHYVSLKIKDAIVDDTRDRTGRRQDVDTQDPDLAVVAHVLQGVARFYLNLNGESLNRRGYRVRQGQAPLRESLAATLLAFAGWSGGRPLHDPMCGSGTLAIEAALIATNRAPGLERTFGCERWPAFDPEWRALLGKLRDEARDGQTAVNTQILASDIDPKSVANTRTNLAVAGLSDAVEVSEADARDVRALEPAGLIVCNPPYGERMGDDAEVIALHEDLSRVVRGFSGHELAFISTTRALKRGVHLKPDAKLEVFNGKLRCQLAKYSIR